MFILGIETSCDETAAAVAEGRDDKVKVLSNVVSSQAEIHKKYGGVVPEVAARQHVLNILPVVNEALEKAGCPLPGPLLLRGRKQIPLNPVRLSAHDEASPARGVNAIAVTVGPGLITSLLVGVETARSLAWAWRLPVVAVNHIEGHIYANWLGPISKSPISSRLELGTKANFQFPILILTVSGGHTMLVLMTGHGQYKMLGETRDDAAGEAFDKAGQLLGLGYPGGPAIAAEAAKARSNRRRCGTRKLEARSINLPRPMIRDRNFDFSFSGLKTALLYALEQDKNWRQRIPEYAAEFQQAVIDVFIFKTIKAAKALNCQTIMLAGGVAANLELRRQLAAAIKKSLAGAKLLIPEFKYCTDNAAMVAAAGYWHARHKNFTSWRKLKTEANLELI
jgi:N6-L-threonylcarbamoyladenine synthase